MVGGLRAGSTSPASGIGWRRSTGSRGALSVLPREEPALAPPRPPLPRHDHERCIELSSLCLWRSRSRGRRRSLSYEHLGLGLGLLHLVLFFVPFILVVSIFGSRGDRSTSVLIELLKSLQYGTSFVRVVGVEDMAGVGGVSEAGCG